MGEDEASQFSLAPLLLSTTLAAVECLSFDTAAAASSAGIIKADKA